MEKPDTTYLKADNVKIIKKLKNSHHSYLITGSITSLILKLLSIVLGYLAMLYITNKYGASVFGALTLSITLLSVFSLIPNFGMSSAIVRIVGELRVNKKFQEITHSIFVIFVFTTFTSVFFAHLLSSNATFIADQILNKWQMAENLVNVSPAIVSGTALVVIASIFHGLQNTKRYLFFQTILHQVLFLFFLIINDRFHFHSTVVEVFVYSNIFAALVAFFFLCVKILKFPRSPQKKTIEYGFCKIVRISVPMLFTTSSMMVMSWTDVLMIGMFKTEADVGVYTAANKVSSLVSIPLIAINVIAIPKFIEFYAKKDAENLQAVAKHSTKLISLVSIPVFLLFLIFAEKIMKMFGAEFIAAAGVLVVLSLGQLVNAICGPVGGLLQMTNNQNYYQNTILVFTLINVGLNYVLVPLYGISGASYATFLSMALLNTVLVFIVKLRLGFWTMSFFGHDKISFLTSKN